MRVFLFTLLLTLVSLRAEDQDAFVEEPNLVGKIAAALIDSKISELTPHKSKEDDASFSYSLQSATYLGTIERGKERFNLATAFFIRSSRKGSLFPPGRGHGFLLCLKPNFKLVSHCRLDGPQEVFLSGTKLTRGDGTIADFSAHDETTRRDGFIIDSSQFLPYPFSDRISK
jgi:hypothetical protein